MRTIPDSVTQAQFEQHILPHLTTAKRGYVNKTPLWGIFKLVLYRLHTGCQWDCLPVSKAAAEREARNEPSWQAVSDQWSQWSADGSWERVWQHSSVTIQHDLDWQQMILDGRHAIAKKGGESVAYQARKRAKT